ncbi:TetR/AcrR family transcriptional regulator [Parvimonas sp. G1967]|uniref:TetR/AcrR family transcriptional regulator n=1 Tax=Parvimonas sp. G1967 TaxID=3387695 RepID=UPI0039E43145
MTNIKDKKMSKEYKIIQAALDIFQEKGYEKTTIRDIMLKTEFGLGTFYLYFKSKQDLKEKIILDKAINLVVQAEHKCTQTDPIERYTCFVNYIIDYLIENPFDLELISQNINWTLYTKIENDKRFIEADTTLKFILSKYEKLFSHKYSYSQKLYILSLTIEIVISTCKSAIMKDSILSIDEMKAVLFEVIKKILISNGD